MGDVGRVLPGRGSPSAPEAIGNRMGRSSFEGQHEFLCSRVAVPLDQRRLPFGQGAGLVEDQFSGSRQLLERVAALDVDPLASCAPDGDGYGQRSRQGQCAGTGDDQQRNGVVPGGGRITGQPDQERDSRQGQHDGDEDAGEPVGKCDDGRSARGTVFDLAEQAGEPRTATGGFDTNPDRSGDVEGAGIDTIAEPGSDRFGFARQQRSIHRRGAGGDEPVGGEGFSGADQNLHVGQQGDRRQFPLGAIGGDDTRGTGSE